MAIAGLTRESIRAEIGANLGAFRSVEADASGTPEKFVTDELSLGGSAEYKGKWLVFTSGTNDGEIRRVVGSSISDNRASLTFHPVVSASTANGDTAELWDGDYNPEDIHRYINRAIRMSYGAVYDPVEDTSLHGGRRQRWDIPSGLSMIKDVQVRQSMDSREVIGLGTKWDESIGTNFDVDTDTEDLLFGRDTIRFTIGGSVGDGEIASDSISSTDFSQYTHIEFPIKVKTAVAADDLILRLSASVNGGASTEEINIPAISALTDTWVRVAMSDPGACTAIISIALEYNANEAANTVWLGGIVATQNDSYHWASLKRHLWRVDKEKRDLITSVDLGYYLLKVTGGDEPAVLNADGTSNEIDDEYVISQATALALLAQSGGRSTDPEERRRLGEFWTALAQQRRISFPMLNGIRRIE